MVFKHWEKKKKKEKITINLESYTSKNVTQEWNQDIFRWMKTKKIGHQQTYPKRIAKGNSLNRKRTKNK